MTGDRRLVVRIDAEKCQGHARCHALAPELFELDEFGSARVRGSGHVSSALEDRAWIARANCPELAIEIVEETPSQVDICTLTASPVAAIIDRFQSNCGVERRQ